MPADIKNILGDKAEDLLSYQCKTADKSKLHLAGTDFVDRI